MPRHRWKFTPQHMGPLLRKKEIKRGHFCMLSTWKILLSRDDGFAKGSIFGAGTMDEIMNLEAHSRQSVEFIHLCVGWFDSYTGLHCQKDMYWGPNFYLKYGKASQIDTKVIKSQTLQEVCLESSRVWCRLLSILLASSKGHLGARRPLQNERPTLPRWESLESKHQGYWCNASD